jgi:hypothetical protein
VPVGVEQQSAPAMIHYQIRGIALDAVARADLDAKALTHSEKAENIEQDPIFAILAERSEFDISE